MIGKPQVQVSLEEKGQARAREIQLIINLLVPDISCQPWYLADDASVLDIYNQRPMTIESRLKAYFGKDFHIEIKQPLWRFVDQIKAMFPEWPDNWDCVDSGEGPRLVKME